MRIWKQQTPSANQHGDNEGGAAKAYILFVGLYGYLQRLAQVQTILVSEPCIVEGNFIASSILPDLLERFVEPLQKRASIY